MSIECTVCFTENSDNALICSSCGSSLESDTFLSVFYLPAETTLRQGRYRIEKVLGYGGFSVTYRGSDEQNLIPIAIKEMQPDKAIRQGKTIVWSPSVSNKDKRFEIREFKSTAYSQRQCIHPNIPKVYDWFEENNTVYIVMELIEGKSLLNILEEEGALEEDRVVNYILQVANALKVVHANKILHRYIQPDNILVDQKDRAVLIGFVAARKFNPGQTSEMTAIVSPRYAPLEQYARNGKKFPATDIYALCVSMYELLTGKLPDTVIDRAIDDTLTSPRQLRPQLSESTERVILKGLKMKVEERIQTADELIEALQPDKSLVETISKDTSDDINLNKLDNLYPSQDSNSFKLVILKIGNISSNQDYDITLNIGREFASFSTGKIGKLPIATEVINAYWNWQLNYRNNYLDVVKRTRISANLNQVTNVSLPEVIAQCNKSANQFKNCLNRWLDSELFRNCKETLLTKLDCSDMIRFIIQVDDPVLRQFPWYLWNFFNSYRKAEVGLASLNFDQLLQYRSSRKNMRVLAILGDSTGIDIQKDRNLLQSFPHTECVFLVEPTQQQVHDHLWDKQGWDILFFAGHSLSQPDSQMGQIYINSKEYLKMTKLRHALSKAIERGLKLAIFNSCDGLGIAKNLADLHIPKTIVMREPVPDAVAQEFLKYFLASLVEGIPFYLAVREARERLQILEDEYPCASWLPVICQNPTQESILEIY